MRFTTALSSSLLLATTTLARPQDTAAAATDAVSTVIAASAATALPITPGSQLTSLNSTTNTGAQLAAQNGTITALNSTMAANSTVAANSTISTSASTDSSDGEVTVWAVKVGNEKGQFVFEPNVINANVGDLIQFQFYARNHSVVSGTFEEPCVPQRNVEANVRNAFFSGFMPTNQSGELLYTIEVQDTKAQWFYCSQAKHCQAGMVGVINPPKTGNQTIEAFTRMAASAPDNLTPTFDGKADMVSHTSNSGNSRAQSNEAGSASTSAAMSSSGSSSSSSNSSTASAPSAAVPFTGAATKFSAASISGLTAAGLIMGFAALLM